MSISNQRLVVYGLIPAFQFSVLSVDPNPDMYTVYGMSKR